MPDQKEPKTIQVGVRLSPQTAERLTQLAEHWHADKTSVIEHGINILADPERDRQAILGNGFGAVEQSLDAWAYLIEQASNDNAKTFTRAEWNYLADVNNGCSPVIFNAGGFAASPQTMLWANAEDAHRLDGTGTKWFPEKQADKKVRELVDKVRGLDFVHGWALAIALQWFWDHCQEIDHQKDEWWTVASRKEVLK